MTKYETASPIGNLNSARRWMRQILTYAAAFLARNRVVAGMSSTSLR